MDEMAFTPSAEEIRCERRASIIIMILLPLPCLATSIFLARTGDMTAAWIFLGLSLAFEFLVAVDRVLLLRGLDGLVLALGPRGVSLRWGKEVRNLGEDGDLAVSLERSALTGKASSLVIRSGGDTIRLPWFRAASGFIEALRRSETKAAEVRRFPWAVVLAAALTLVAGLLHLLPSLPGLWLWPWVTFSFASLFFAYPLHPFLGPRFRIWDRFLFGAVALCGALLAIFALGVTLEAGDLTLLSIPREPGPERSIALLQLGRSGRDRSRPLLLDLLRTGDPHDRRDSALALRFQRRSEVVEALRLASFDREPDVRRAAVHSLGSVGGTTAFRTLISVLESDANLSVAREANQALEQLTGLSFKAGFGSGLAREEDRRLALAFWRAVLRG